MRKLVVIASLALGVFCFGDSSKSAEDIVDTLRKNLSSPLVDQDNMVFFGRLAALGMAKLDQVNKKLVNDLVKCGHTNPFVIIESIDSLKEICPSVASDLVYQITITNKAKENVGIGLTIETMFLSAAGMLVTAGQLEEQERM